MAPKLASIIASPNIWVATMAPVPAAIPCMKPRRLSRLARSNSAQPSCPSISLIWFLTCYRVMCSGESSRTAAT